MGTACAVKMENITKKFGSIVANHNINLELHEGEILSLLGENGSGKTTLMNMLSGIYYPDEGQIYIHGKPVTIASPKDAFDNGIGMIHQHFKLVDVFTATENIVLGLEGKLNLADASKKVREICEKYGFNFEIAMLETIKEISSRTGTYDKASKKWIKDTSDEARAKWYKADYEKARL